MQNGVRFKEKAERKRAAYFITKERQKALGIAAIKSDCNPSELLEMLIDNYLETLEKYIPELLIQKEKGTFSEQPSIA